MESIFPLLDDDQQKAMVLPAGSRTALIASAGSGKTTVTTARAAFVRKTAQNPFGSVLCVTYTNEAAGELRRRLTTLMNAPGALQAFAPLEHKYPGVTSRFWTGTLHSFAKRVIEGIIAPPVWFSLPQEERDRLVSITPLYQHLADNGGTIRNIIEGKRADVLWSTTVCESPDLGELFLRRWKRKREEICGIWSARQASQIFQHVISAPISHPTEQEALRRQWNHLDITNLENEAAFLYQTAKQNQLGVDYNDMLWMAAAALRYLPHLRTHYRQQLSHILLDEAQDISFLDYIFLQTLPGFDPMVTQEQDIGYTLTGDPRQEIFDFRSGQPGIFMSLVNGGWPDQISYLRTNYRSGPAIVDLASQVAQNPNLAMQYENTPDLVPHVAPNAAVAKATWTILKKGDALQLRLYPLLSASLADTRIQSRAILVRTNFMRQELEPLLETIRGAKEHFDLVTIHSAKGREWDHVILCGLATGKFPTKTSFWRSPAESLQSESRVLYVALTRARLRLDVFESESGTFYPTLDVKGL